MLVAQTLLLVVVVYAVCGLAFAAAFVTVGAGHLDQAVKATSVVFRLLLVPGATALWPLLLVRWCRAARTGGTP